MSYTKGEWKNIMSKDELFVTSAGNTICQIIVSNNEDCKDEFISNAQLISASPDLKQIARECLDWFMVKDGELESGQAYHYKELKKMLKKAIAKSEGGEMN